MRYLFLFWSVFLFAMGVLFFPFWAGGGILLFGLLIYGLFFFYCILVHNGRLFDLLCLCRVTVCGRSVVRDESCTVESSLSYALGSDVLLVCFLGKLE